MSAALGCHIAALNFSTGRMLNCLITMISGAHRDAAMVLRHCREIAALPQEFNAAIIAIFAFFFYMFLAMARITCRFECFKPCVRFSLLAFDHAGILFVFVGNVSNPKLAPISFHPAQ